MPSIDDRGRRGARCHCWNASRTGHLIKSVTDACEGVTIDGSCTEQRDTTLVLSWCCLERCAARNLAMKRLNVLFMIVWTSPLDIEVAKEDRQWFPSVPVLHSRSIALWVRLCSPGMSVWRTCARLGTIGPTHVGMPERHRRLTGQNAASNVSGYQHTLPLHSCRVSWYIILI